MFRMPRKPPNPPDSQSELPISNGDSGAFEAMAAANTALAAERDAANAANRAKSDFLAVMSHEIRTPMNAILGVTELALETAATEEQRSLLRTVRTNADELMLLVNEILDFSKIEAGQVTIAEERCFVSDLIESVAEVMSARANLKGIDITADVDPAIPVMMLGDPTRLRQILSNLVSNAVKFTHSGGVVISAEVMERHDRALHVHFTVHDTGVGIPDEAQARIFQRFYQVDSSLRRAYGGTGLGLSICKSLAELMGGRIWLESVPGAGSEFHFTLPFVLTDDEPPARRLSDQGFAGRRAIFVCSDKRTRPGMERVLQSLRFDVTVVDETPAALGGVLRATLATDDALSAVVVLDAAIGAEAVASAMTVIRAQPVVHAVLVAARTTGDEQHVATASGATLLAKPLARRRTADIIGELLHIVPAHPATQSVVERRKVRAPRAVGGRVLVVEDNPDTRLLATAVLERAGYDVDTAVDGAEGLRLATEKRWDLIITDLEMPQLDGIAMTEAVRQREHEHQLDPVPVIALTAHVLEGVRDRTRDAGMNDFIPKPIQRDAFLAVVRRHIDLRPVILVADDTPDSRFLMRRMLDGRGYRILEAADGDAVLALFDAGRVSMVLLDMSMPVRDGFSTARELRKRSRGQTLPVIAVTGYADAEDKAKCLAAGCTGYLTKPVRRDTLVAAVEQAVGRQEPVTAPHMAPVVVTSGVDDGAPPVEIDADIADLIPMYLSGRRADVERARVLVAQGSFEELGTIGHHLKGNGQSYGFTVVTRIGRELEAAAVQRDALHVTALTEELSAWERSVRWTAVAVA